MQIDSGSSLSYILQAGYGNNAYVNKISSASSDSIITQAGDNHQATVTQSDG
jgi:hypothetical protein